MSFKSKSPDPSVPEVQPPATPVPTERTPVDLTPARISHDVDNNGYLDPDQTIVNYAIREVGITFEQLIKQDPSRLLREWRGEYRKSKSASLLSLGLGATGVICGVFTGATPLLMAGVAIAAVAGFTTKHFSSGAESRDIELELIDKLHPVLQLLDQLERRGVNPSALVSIYDTIARAAFANPNLATISPSHLKELFETELKRSEVLKQFAQQPTGLSAVAPTMPPLPPTPASLSTSPVGAQTRLTAIDVPSPVSVPVPSPATPQNLPAYEDIFGFDGVDFDESEVNSHLRFDWNELRNGDLHPMIAIVAPMDGGKSRLTKWLAKHVLFGELPDRSNLAALDVMGADWEWEGCKIVRSYPQMVYLMAWDLAMQQARLEAWQNRQPGQEPDDLFSPILRILEEFTATLPALRSLKAFSLPDTANERVKAVFDRLKTPAAIVDEWKLNHGSITRKLRSRAVFISTELVADAFDMSAGKRSSMTIIFPGIQGMALAMNDQRIIGLGQKQHQGLREQLLAESNKFKRSALIYSCGRWMVGEIPELDDRGDVLKAGAQVAQTIKRIAQPLQDDPLNAVNLSPMSMSQSVDFDELIEEDLPTVPDDDLELNLMLYFLNRKGQKKSSRDISKSGAKWTKGLKQSDLDEFLILLHSEGKLKREGEFFYY